MTTLLDDTDLAAALVAEPRETLAHLALATPQRLS